MLAGSERKHRLPLQVYKGHVSVAFTACTRNRAWVFSKTERVELASQVLLCEAARWKCEVVIYLFMPDHLHIVLRGASDESDAYQVMPGIQTKDGISFF
jgi:REP element-mobilizing transposase RayT